jgi:hypothetical protein
MTVVLISSTACPAGTHVGGMRRTIQEFAARIVLGVITVLRLLENWTSKAQKGEVIHQE